MPSDRASTQIGKVFQINSSKGGVPKIAQHQAQVTNLGLHGDEHRSSQHGGPDRALCLYSLERILALQAEGHPVFPGSTGENLTLSGLDWEQVKPGVRLRLGKDVLIEVTGYTTPCSNIRHSFLEEEIARMLQDKHPGWSRVYARVLQQGEILAGDLVAFA